MPIPPIDALPASPPPSPGDGAWQPLPEHARGVLMLSHALGFGLPAIGLAIGAAVLSGNLLSLRSGIAIAIALLLWLAGVAFGAWIGHKRWKTTLWRLDETGFSLRKGRMWQSEVRVPRTRVQHLDLKRGPLERTRKLASLVLHTAGTRERAVTLPALDEGDAERLRDALARQIEQDDDE